MQNFKKNRRKANSSRMMNMPLSNEQALDKEPSEDLERGCGKMKYPNSCKKPCEKPCEEVCNTECHHHVHNAHSPHCADMLPCTKKCEPCCEPCEVEAASNNCMKNPCTPGECCSPLILPRVNSSNTVPYAIEAERVFDTMQFQMFQDATTRDGSQIYFIYDVDSVNGRIPMSGTGNFVAVKIDEVCFDFSEIQIYPGDVSIEGYSVDPVDPVDTLCESIFESYVCGERNSVCCQQGRGAQSKFRERGLFIEVKDLLLSLKGHCGCTEVVINAVPAYMDAHGNLCECSCIGFRYNTLASEICIPASGMGIKLRQKYETKLSVSCISDAQLQKTCPDGEVNYNVNIPGGIDLILCVQEIVSILMQEQIVVLGAAAPIEPRVVDTFSRVCEFTSCAPRVDTAVANNDCGCGCNK